MGILDKKVVLITGTGGGLGRVAAQTFAREGAKVVGCDIKVDVHQALPQRPIRARRGGGVTPPNSRRELSLKNASDSVVVFLSVIRFGIQ